MIFKSSLVFITIENNINSVITIQMKLQSVNCACIDVVFSNVTHPYITEIASIMATSHGYPTIGKVEVVLELDTITPQTDPEPLHNAQWEKKGGYEDKVSK